MAFINDIGKTIASVRRGSVLYNFFNTTLVETSQVNFVSDNDSSSTKYSLTISNTDGNNYRALHYIKSFVNDAIDTKIRPVLYINRNIKTDYGILALPIYEAIAPSINKYHDGQIQISWWSNVNGILEMDQTNRDYLYDSSKILKFSTKRLGDIQDNTNGSKILCTAFINWERLRQINGVAADSIFSEVPVIDHIIILQCISGQGYITDFDMGGNGGGIGIHAHTNNRDGGLAVATFAPSAMMRPIAWS